MNITLEGTFRNSPDFRVSFWASIVSANVFIAAGDNTPALIWMSIAALVAVLQWWLSRD